jgi:hypothetical protein
MAGADGGEYFVARIEGRDVAGIGSLSDRGGPASAVWSTSVFVESADETVQRATDAGGRLLFGPLDALPAGRLAVLADPAGAPFGVWEARERVGAWLVNEPGTWMMSSLHTPEPDVASAFYGTVFGWQAEPAGPDAPITLLRLPGYVGGEPGQSIPRDVVAVMTAIDSGPGKPAVPPHWNVNFRIDDADESAARAVELGASILMGPVDTTGFRSAAVLDPQGAAFSISQVQ